VGGPGIDAKATLSAHPMDIVLVEDFKPKPKSRIQFLFPLKQHRRRSSHNDVTNLLPHEKFARDQSGFDRFRGCGQFR
jgi:molybdopterin-guanine dinucleotide biosynthesis protein